jgi:ornithine carbamoyltransferase
MSVRHFLDLSLIAKADARAIVDAAHIRKQSRLGKPKGTIDADRPLDGHALTMIFDKPSTRTRVSFDLAMCQLGGKTIVLNQSDTQLGRGETIADTAQVLSRFSDAIMVRTGAHSHIEEFANHASVPIINGLTAFSHPCQILADILTFEEHKGPIKGQKLAWFGDGNNVAISLVQAAALFEFELHLAIPEAFMLPEDVTSWARQNGATIEITQDAKQAAKDAEALITDCWVSMSDSPETAEARATAFAPYMIDEELMSYGADPIFMHCLPAYRDNEVSGAVMDGPASVVFDEAENRVHAQKEILIYCLGK